MRSKTPPEPLSDKSGDSSVRTALIWDLPLRVFHWSMVTVVALAALSGYLAPDSWLSLHVYFGYALGLLLTFRIVWGLFGNYYSRFPAFR